MRLIDVNVLKSDYGMADDCKDCKTGYRSCQYDNTYTKMNFCGWLDDAETVDAIPVEWIKKQIEWLKSLDNIFSSLTANNIQAMLNSWKREQHGETD